MTQDVYKNVEEIIMLHADAIRKIGLTAEQSDTIVKNMVKLAELQQKADEEEARHSEAQERLAYDNGREDLRLRDEEHRIANEAEKLELDKERLKFEREKFQVEIALKEETNRIEAQKLTQGNFGLALQAAGTTIGTIFKGWLSTKILTFEETGVVASFLGKRMLGNMLNNKD